MTGAGRTPPRLSAGRVSGCSPSASAFPNTDSLIEYSFEDCLREVLNESAERRVAVLDPLKLVIDNYPAGEHEAFAPNHPLKPGTRQALDALLDAGRGSSVKTSWKSR